MGQTSLHDTSGRLSLSTASTPTPRLSPSGAASGVSRVERAELSILRQRATWVSKEIATLRYLFGSDVWFRTSTPVSASGFLRAFIERTEPGTEGGYSLSTAELAQVLAVPVPSSVSAGDIRAFVDRWNRSVAYWSANIFYKHEVPPGQSTDFIAMDVLRDTARGSIEADAEARAAGFLSTADSYNRAGADIIRFLGEGGSGGVCAHVRLRLDQELVSTRTAFRASLEIENTLSEALDQLGIELQVRRRTGEDASNLFALRPPTLSGLNAVDGTGTLAGGTSGQAQWTLIPTTDAAIDGPVEFLVTGRMHYRQGGLELNVPLAPATITVLPSPSLAVKYFHQRDVFGDDPFTVAIEPSVPYSLAVMVQNRGHGAARDVRISSAQPRIVENEKGLFADFRILATEVAGQNLSPSLTVNFGTINPGTNAIGRWLLVSSLLGGFIEYSASFEHLDGLGEKRLSLVEGVEIHELIHVVRATGAHEDDRPDFLANDVPDLLDYPDTLHLSDGTVESVGVVTSSTVDRVPSPENLEVVMKTGVSEGWVYLRIPDPAAGQFRIAKVVRSDGGELLLGENVWTTDRTFLGNARRPIPEHTLHLFDHGSTGTYKLIYAPNPEADLAPPTSGVTVLPAENTAVFPVSWAGNDNSGGTGISFFDVYVSVDQEPFRRWQQETLDRSALYQGALGHNYAFYSIATDEAGNREAPPAIADASTLVTRTNRPPVLEAVADWSLKEGETLVISPVARDPDGDSVVFSLGADSPSGMVVHPYTGKITWVTGEGSGPKSYPVVLQVLDNGSPRLGATRRFSVTVSDENSPPILASISDRTVREGELVLFTNQVSDPDLPRQHLVFSLGTGSPSGATLDPSTGVFRWIPNDSQGGLTYQFQIQVRDDGSPSLTAVRDARIVVRDTRSDFTLRIGSTNAFAGTPISTPISLTSGDDLARVEFDLFLEDPRLGSPSLRSASDELLIASLEPIQEGQYRMRFEFDPNRIRPGSREVGRLVLEVGRTSHSSVARLQIKNLSGFRFDGRALGNAESDGARVFVVEKEPLIDLNLNAARALEIVVFGLPGREYRLQQSPVLSGGAFWSELQSVTLEDSHQILQLPVDLKEGRFLRIQQP